MKTVGFPISHKENENRRAMIPPDVSKISHPEALFFEHGYGNVMGFSDSDYEAVGANVAERNTVLSKNIILLLIFNILLVKFHAHNYIIKFRKKN